MIKLYLFHRISIVLIGTVLALVPLQLTASKENISAAIAVEAKEFPTVDSAGLEPNLRVPWSEPVRVTDPFEGNFLAVFVSNDLQDSRYRKVISLWSRDFIQVLLTDNQRRCSIAYSASLYHLGPSCRDISTSKTVSQLYIRVSDRVFQLAGDNGRFEVTNELASVLKNASEQNVDIRLVLEGGESVDSEIGKGTVRAWRAIY